MTRLMPLFALSLVIGCAHKNDVKEDKSPAAQPTQASTAQDTRPTTPDKLCSTDLDCGDKQLCIRQHCVDISADLAECGLLRVHFAFNGSEVDPADKSALERSARCLKADHAMHVTIEGNADERGTEEYNLALGDRRATAVSKYLQLLGVSEAQLKTVSYGKENPLCTEHDEACWAKNRQAALKPNVAQAPETKKKKAH